MTAKKSTSAKRATSSAIKKDAPSSLATLSQQGETGLKRSHGYIYEEFLNELTGEKGIRVLKEMSENDPIIGAMLFAVEYFMRQVKWFVDAPPNDPEGENKAEFIRECKDDMSITWSDFIAEVMSMLPYGWSYFETLFKRRVNALDSEGNPISKFNDKRYGWDSFEIRSQDALDHWEFDDETGRLIGMWQRPAPDYQLRYVPLAKALHFKTTSRKGNPEGRSVLRNAYRPWYFKKRIEEIEGVGIERDLAGLPMAEVPADMLREDASDSDKAMIAGIVELLKNVRRDEQEGVIWPQQYDPVSGNKMYEFKLMNSGGTRAFSTNDTITRYESRMAITLLVDFILLGNDSQGSFAMATSKAGLFQSVLSVWLTGIEDVLNKSAIPRLMRLNGMSAPYPKFRADDVQKPGIADLATFIAALAGAGAQLFPDVELENYLRRMALLPQREEEEKDKKTEDELRDEKLAADVEAARYAKEHPEGPPMPQLGTSNGKTTNTKAPTKTTGPVKSKLPPRQRRSTAKDAAGSNVKKQYRIAR